MRELIFATHNRHKAREIQALLPKGYAVQTLAELGYTDDIAETGKTLRANAEIKARTVFKHFGRPCFADDTGLMVDALQGAPGVYSARYAGPKATFDENVTKLLSQLQGAALRSARFTTVICYVDEQGKSHFTQGEVEGEITLERQGEGGFGYDPIFLPKGAAQTFAQMSAEAKNARSHRGQALSKFMDFLADLNQKS